MPSPTSGFHEITGFIDRDDDEIRDRASAFSNHMRSRRSVRQFSSREVPPDILEQCVVAAASAPSGANQQPWYFSVVTDLATKQRIQVAAEQEEHTFYSQAAPQKWLDAIEPLGTSSDKSFLVDAGALIVVFVQRWSIAASGDKVTHYYSQQSVGIATGILVAAVHMAGLTSLTYTPSATRFLNELLGRPDNERPFLVLAVGHPAHDAQVPEIERKPLHEVAEFIGT